MVSVNQKFPMLDGGLSDFLLHSGEVELAVLDQLFWPLTAAPILSPLPSLVSLGTSSLSPSLSAVWQLLLPCCHSQWHLTGARGDRGDEGKWREKKEPPVTPLLWSCMAARFNLLRYWFPKPNNCNAMVFSGPSPAETRIERWPDEASTSLCVCVCLHLGLFL